MARRLVLAFVLLAPAVVWAQSTPSRSRDDAALVAALCHGRRACRVASVLDAGRDGHGERLAVVRLVLGREPEEGCHAYSDRLGVWRAGAFRPLRELSRGDSLCLEWSPSSWSFENGELIFEHGGMGAPPPSGVDTRPLRTHLRPSPLAIVAEFRGGQPVTPLPTLPTRGPIFVLSMEQ